MTFPVRFVVALRYVLDITTPLYLFHKIASLLTSSTIPRYVRFASTVTRVDEVSDVTSVNTRKVLQQCTGSDTNIQFEITYSTTVVEFSTTMALVVLMARCNFVSAGTETVHSTEAMGHFPL